MSVFDNKKSISRNTKWIDVAPNNILRSYEVKRSIFARNWTERNSLFVCIFTQSHNEYAIILKKLIMLTWNIDNLYINWINRSLSTHLCTYTMINHEKCNLAPSFRCLVHVRAYHRLISLGSESDLVNCFKAWTILDHGFSWKSSLLLCWRRKKRVTYILVGLRVSKLTAFFFIFGWTKPL